MATTTSDKCLDSRTLNGRTDICRRSKGHDESRDPARREHHNGHTWPVTAKTVSRVRPAPKIAS